MHGKSPSEIAEQEWFREHGAEVRQPAGQPPKHVLPEDIRDLEGRIDEAARKHGISFAEREGQPKDGHVDVETEGRGARFPGARGQ